jgi:hypothetical protein
MINVYGVACSPRCSLFSKFRLGESFLNSCVVLIAKASHAKLSILIEELSGHHHLILDLVQMSHFPLSENIEMVTWRIYNWTIGSADSMVPLFGCVYTPSNAITFISIEVRLIEISELPWTQRTPISVTIPSIIEEAPVEISFAHVLLLSQ